MKFFMLLTALSLFAWAGDFSKAQDNYTKSRTAINGIEAFKTDHGWLAFSPTPIDNSLVVRSNPNLGLYLLKSNKEAPSLSILNKTPKEVASFKASSFSKNRILDEQYGMDDLAQLKIPAPVGSMILGHCGTLRGFVAQNGVVTSRYINDFIFKKDNYTTLGFRLKASKEGMKVESVNPFFSYNPFKIDDVIIYHDAKKESMYALTDSILRSKVGTKHYFLVKRGKSFKHLEVIAKKRYGGGVFGDTFLEYFGLNFDKNLGFIQASKNSQASKLLLRKGDKLIAINGVNIVDNRALRIYLSTVDIGKPLRLLMQRSGLQFFITVSTHNLITTSQK